VVEHSFHDPDRFFVDPATLSPEQIGTQQANMASLRALAGDPYMHDPSLHDRLADVRTPTLVIWGDSDGIATPAYGRAYAGAFPDATFELVADAGHLPQIEQPAATLALIDAYAAPRVR
jgi:pimeloyl-ACP methyl ester carboxylesterase